MIYISDISTEGKIGSVLFLSNGINDIEYLGWNREEKEKEGVFIENEPEDFSTANYLYIDGELVPVPVDIEELVDTKCQEIKKSCESAIISGTDADVLGRGLLHYSLTETKQDDIKVLMQNIQNGAEGVLWHDDSRVMHEIYTAEQFTALYQILFAYIITCKITSDGLEQYIKDSAENGDIELVESITWGTTLPEYIQTQVDEQIVMMLGG